MDLMASTLGAWRVEDDAVRVGAKYSRAPLGELGLNYQKLQRRVARGEESEFRGAGILRHLDENMAAIGRPIEQFGSMPVSGKLSIAFPSVPMSRNALLAGPLAQS